MKKVLLAVIVSITCISSIESNNINNVESSFKQQTVYSTGDWTLQFIDGCWWWVIYDTDGSIIMKIPADF